MPKLKMPKSSPSIDMTPMVDLAFLLVTFFMLSASFRNPEPFEVSLPSSLTDKDLPKNAIVVTVDKAGKIYFNVSNAEAKTELLDSMASYYKIDFSDKEKEKFKMMSSFSCPINQLKDYINADDESRKKDFPEGIPSDTTVNASNELRYWIQYGEAAARNAGKTSYIEAKKKNPEVKIEDFKLKLVLRVDGDAEYSKAKKVIDVFRDLKLNNLYFVTSMEVAPI
jgi:biopolymer transport protein ExbD